MGIVRARDDSCNNALECALPAGLAHQFRRVRNVAAAPCSPRSRASPARVALLPVLGYPDVWGGAPDRLWPAFIGAGRA